MRLSRSRMGLLTVAFVAAPLLAFADGWPRLGAALDRWSGDREAVVLTDREDPLAVPELQELLELLSVRGYTARILPSDSRQQKELILDVRFSAAGVSVALIRGADQTVLAFERREAQKVSGTEVAAPPATTAPPERSKGVSAQEQESAQSESAWGKLGPFPLAEPAVGIGVLRVEGAALHMVLLRDGDLQLATLATGGLRTGASFLPPVKPARALHVDVIDLDGDGAREILATWGEDERGVYVGRDTVPHGWILREAGQSLRAVSDDMRGYVRAALDQGFAQGRTPDQPWGGPVRAIVRADRHFTLGEETTWPFADLWRGSPWDDGFGLVWEGPGRLALVSPTSSASSPASVLLADLGRFTGPEVAVRLTQPEFRSGFAKEDQVRERLHPLPRRVAIGPDGAGYTIQRGRNPGLPLVGSPSGQDRLVRLRREGSNVRMETPFAPVDAFILDFALVPEAGGSVSAVLLLSDDERGQGTCYLGTVSARP